MTIPPRVSPALKKHLKIPSPIKKSVTRKSINRIGAISSTEWREFEKQKEEEKERKKSAIATRKLQKQVVKEKREADARKRKQEKIVQSTMKKRKVTNKNSSTCTEIKIKCAECEEEIISDTEFNDLKNIGCDDCLAWYHLKCSTFMGKLYEEVMNLPFKCPKSNILN
ncbi:hypothetical protein NQ314_011089 [Rhamnusium bicolor]|uniref:Zinc finger PHD-type domain-containing protein n=1 Tax=Rhamnusium bicolor TaxID=1586634 RepID=A0AAV8XMC4_9CUCU|nr:hypothetical protein NQ314_011089 [Rhamnusium bicolor]